MQEKVCRILFVEDNHDTAQLVTMILESPDHRVTCVATIEEALELLARSAFDLYLLDTRLPDGSGIELCRQIRASDPNTPIIFFSAAAFETDKRRAIEAGADAYVTKPIDPSFLVQKVAGL